MKHLDLTEQQSVLLLYYMSFIKLGSDRKLKFDFAQLVTGPEGNGVRHREMTGPVLARLLLIPLTNTKYSQEQMVRFW